MSAKQIFEHPFVVMMMQSLEALEAKQSDALLKKHHELTKEITTTCNRVQRI